MTLKLYLIEILLVKNVIASQNNSGTILQTGLSLQLSIILLNTARPCRVFGKKLRKFWYSVCTT